MYSAFPKCSLTQASWITSALPAIQTALVQVKSLSYTSWKNILRIKVTKNLGGIQFSREVEPFVLMKLTYHQTLVFHIVIWHIHCFPVNWKSCKVRELFWSVVKIQPRATIKFLTTDGQGIIIVACSSQHLEVDIENKRALVGWCWDRVWDKLSARKNWSFPYQPPLPCLHLKQAVWSRVVARC